jgi:phosphotransferase system enzyme I (PtsI)
MRPDIFLPQLRALIRASVYGELVILLPMVTSVEEVKRVAELMKTLKTALAEEGFSVGQYTLGVMIETPAAALIARELSEVARYFSIGTNDLLQYTVAIDREHPTLGASCDAHHPALLRLISETVAAAHECGVTVAICGELAGDAALTEWLLSLEIDTLSVSPSKLLPLKEEIARVLKAKP